MANNNKKRLEGQEKPSMYVYDLEKIMSFVFDLENSKNTSSTEILENYTSKDNTMELSSKSIKESKGNISRSTQSDNIRYDLIKYFINELEEIPSNIEDDELSFGEKAIINTMINEEFLKLV